MKKNMKIIVEGITFINKEKFDVDVIFSHKGKMSRKKRGGKYRFAFGFKETAENNEVAHATANYITNLLKKFPLESIHEGKKVQEWALAHS